MRRAGQAWLTALLLFLVSGCAQWKQPPPEARSILKPASGSPESVTLEIFFARFPLGTQAYNGPLWDAVDEQLLPGRLRHDLRANGLRAGVVGGQVPDHLAELLRLTDERQQTDALPTVNLEEEPVVRRRLLQLRDGRRGEIVASPLLEQCPLMIAEGGQIAGQTFTQAQGLLAVEPRVTAARRVALLLTPELHHGEPKQQFTGQDGIFRLAMARPREVYAQLAMEVPLAPGQMLLVSCLPDRPGSLGYQFFTDGSSGGREQKLLVVRLAAMPEQEPFATADLPPRSTDR